MIEEPLARLPGAVYTVSHSTSLGSVETPRDGVCFLVLSGSESCPSSRYIGGFEEARCNICTVGEGFFFLNNGCLI